MTRDRSLMVPVLLMPGEPRKNAGLPETRDNIVARTIDSRPMLREATSADTLATFGARPVARSRSSLLISTLPCFEFAPFLVLSRRIPTKPRSRSCPCTGNMARTPHARGYEASHRLSALVGTLPRHTLVRESAVARRAT